HVVDGAVSHQQNSLSSVEGHVAVHLQKGLSVGTLHQERAVISDSADQIQGCPIVRLNGATGADRQPAQRGDRNILDQPTACRRERSASNSNCTIQLYEG